MFFAAIIVYYEFIQLCGYFILLIWIQMGISIQSGLNLFVAKTLCDKKRCTAHVNQQTGVGMTYSMHPDLLNPGLVTAVFHLTSHIAFVIREDTVSGLQPVDAGHIRTDAGFQRLWHHNISIPLFGLRRIDILLSVQSLIVLVDRNDVLVKVDILRGQSEQLSNTESRIIHNHEYHDS